MVQDSVARFVDDEVLPVIQKHFEEHTLPTRADPRDSPRSDFSAARSKATAAPE